MRLILERWEKGKDERTGEEIELIKEEVEVGSEEEVKGKADELSSKEGTTRVTLHRCYHDESPSKACTREELFKSG